MARPVGCKQSLHWRLGRWVGGGIAGIRAFPLTRRPATVVILPLVSTLRTQLFCVSEM